MAQLTALKSWIFLTKKGREWTAGMAIVVQMNMKAR